MCVCIVLCTHQKAPHRKTLTFFFFLLLQNGTNEKRESTRHRIKLYTHAHANNLLMEHDGFLFVFFFLLLLLAAAVFCYFIFRFTFFSCYKHTVYQHQHQQPPKKLHRSKVKGKKTSAGNWRVFKWKFTLNLKYLVNERVLFVSLLYYTLPFLCIGFHQNGATSVKNVEERKSNWTHESTSDGVRKKMLEMGKRSVLLNKTSNITSCEKTFRYGISNQRWISNNRKKAAAETYTHPQIHAQTLAAAAANLYTGVPLAICY